MRKRTWKWKDKRKLGLGGWKTESREWEERRAGEDEKENVEEV